MYCLSKSHASTVGHYLARARTVLKRASDEKRGEGENGEEREERRNRGGEEHYPPPPHQKRTAALAERRVAASEKHASASSSPHNIMGKHKSAATQKPFWFR